MDYIISVKELLEKAEEMNADGMEFVCLSLMEEDATDPDDILPPAVHFSAFERGSSGAVDYDCIEVAPSGSF